MRDALPRPLLHSVATRLALIGTLVMGVVVAAVLGVEMSHIDGVLRAREAEQLRQLEVIAPPALLPLLEHRDTEAAGDLLEKLRGREGYRYLALLDRDSRMIAAAGWSLGQALPRAQAAALALASPQQRVDGFISLGAGDEVKGWLQFGLDRSNAEALRREVLLDGLMLALALVAVGALSLAWVGVRLHRHLVRLGNGLTALEEGRLPVKLPVRGPAEVRALTRSLNRSAQVLRQKIEALRAGEARFHAIADFTYGAELWFNPRGRLIWVNRSIERITGFTPLECVLAGNLIELLVYQKDRKFVTDSAAGALKGSSGSNLELRLQRKEGSVAWVAANWQPIYSAEGEYIGLRVSLDEIQARKEAELKLLETVAEVRRAQGLKDFYLQRSNEERLRLEALLDVMKIGVLFVDRDQRVRYCNRAMFRLWGIDETRTLAGVRTAVLLEHVLPRAADPDAYRAHIDEVIAARGLSEPHDVVLDDGRIINDVSAPVPGAQPGRVLGRVWIYEDVTEPRRWTQRLTELAERDPLTNLFNRRRFNEELVRWAADAARRESQLGLMVIDLDGFKPINDQCGHQAGDEVLVRIAAQVGAAVRRNEMFFRLGGDEFAILAPDTDGREMEGLAKRVATRIAEQVFDFEGRKYGVTASLGIALYPQDADTCEALISGADAALYEAKEAGKNRWQVFRRKPPGERAAGTG